MPPDRLVVVDSETQEIAWRRSQVDNLNRNKKNIQLIDECPQSKGVKKYKFKIKKENERCLEYLVEDLDHEDENIKFIIPLAFQVLHRCINIAKCTTVRTERSTERSFKALLKSSL